MRSPAYHRLADVVMWLHAAFVLFALVGAVFAPLGSAWLLFHLVILAWAVGINFGGCTCPLTPLENRLREAAGQSGYSGGFIQHYLERLGLAGLSQRQLEVRVAWALLLWNGALYAALFTIA